MSQCPASQGLSLWVSEPPSQCLVATSPCFMTLWGSFFLGKRYLSPNSPPKSYPAFRDPLMNFFHGNSSRAVLCLVTQSCPTLCNPMDCIAHQAPLSMGILQARMLRWVAMPSSRGFCPTQGSNPVLPHCKCILYH